MWPQCYINRKCLHEVFSLLTRYINCTYIGVSRGGAGGHGPSKFLDYLVILCFKRQYIKQNTVARLKSKILTHPKFWACNATAHISI